MAEARAKKKRTRRTRGQSGVQLGELVARAMVLQGTAALLVEGGAHAVAVADILARAGVARRTFYRFYKNKDEVLAELYRLGTERLIQGCNRAVGEESDALMQVRRCIDTHLVNARELGRLVFVLGGEAQRHESPLHALRDQVHAAVAEILASAAARRTGADVDPLLFRTLVLALEGATRSMLEQADEGRQVTEEDIERVRRVMDRVATGALAGEGRGVTPLPRTDG